MTDLIENSKETSIHTRIEYNLAILASAFKFNFHIATNDKNKLCDEKSFKDLEGYSEEVITISGNKKIQKAIGLIDIFWSKNHIPKYSFEIEDSTTIHSGIRRMFNILSENPDTKIISVIVYPDERKSEIIDVIENPLYDSIRNEMRFLSYSKLTSKIKEIKKFIDCIEPKKFMESLLDSYEIISGKVLVNIIKPEIKSLNLLDIKINQKFSNEDLVNTFKCANLGGMRKSKKTNSLILIINHTKNIYKDTEENGIINFVGMGTKGNQSLEFMQNKTLNNSNINNINLLLFEVLEKRKYIYRRKVKLIDKPHIEKQQDCKKNMRDVYIFPLKIIN